MHQPFHTTLNNSPLFPSHDPTKPIRISLLGGGQLGFMLIESAHRLGIYVSVLDPNPDAPCFKIANEFLVGSFNDPDTVRDFIEQTEPTVITIEIEHVHTKALSSLNLDVPVFPCPAIIDLIQDKYAQKILLDSRHLPVGSFMPIDCISDLQKVVHTYGFPFFIKSRRQAYDGRGNFLIHSQANLNDALSHLFPQEITSIKPNVIYAERYIPFSSEISVMVALPHWPPNQGDIAQDHTIESSNIITYPAVTSTHANNILRYVTVPACVPQSVQEKACSLAKDVIFKISLSIFSATKQVNAGIFCVEMFVCSNQKEGEAAAEGEEKSENHQLLINEIAPRPHNSGHYSIESCTVSQFEQHIRCILGFPLGSTELIYPYAFMINLLGLDEDHAELNAEINRMVQHRGIFLHSYYKVPRPQRKIGHLTILANTKLEMVGKLEKCYPLLDLMDITPDKIPIMISQSILANDAPGDPVVAIVMGSDSDLETMIPAASILKSWSIPFELTIVSAHRTPKRMYEFAERAQSRGIKVIIAGAGGAAHLPGMIAAITPLPVIGVPVLATSLQGLDSLLSIVQMPRGVPVATVAINNSTNAAWLAIRILAIGNTYLTEKLMEHQQEQQSQVIQKANEIENIGYENYFKEHGFLLRK